MKIGELKPGMTDVEIEGKVTKVSDPRQVNTKYGPRSVANADIEDGSGSIQLTLWSNQISSVKEKDKVKITGGFVKEWNGQMQISVTKQGEIQIL